ncbi:hypothetical protein D3C78_467370 [compost metagenome]
MLAQRLGRGRQARARQVTGGRTADEWNTCDMPRQQLVFQLRCDAQAHVDILTRVVDASISRYQLYRKQRVPGAECRYQGRQHVTTECRGGGNAQPPLRLAVGRSDGLFGLGKVALDQPDPLVIERTGRGQRHAAGGTAEQAHLQMGFQASEVLTDRRGADPEAARSAGVAAGLDHLDESADGVEQIHVEPFYS